VRDEILHPHTEQNLKPNAMANTYTQIHIHAIFAVKKRRSLIQNDWKDELYKYITGIIQEHNHRVLAINGISDHIHIFFGMRPTQSLSDLMQDIKGSSSKWINERKFTKQKFEWQEGYGAFSYSKSQASKVIGYIQNQEAHHRKTRFSDEYRAFLDKFEVSFNERYLFTIVR
jgi:REP element-mobilizing transposase RayT